MATGEMHEYILQPGVMGRQPGQADLLATELGQQRRDRSVHLVDAQAHHPAFLADLADAVQRLQRRAVESPSGSLDQGGNVAEWLANDAEAGQRVVRGGSYADDRFALERTADSLDRDAVLREPFYEGAEVGFRVVQVPEASAVWMGLSGLFSLLVLRARRRGGLRAA